MRITKKFLALAIAGTLSVTGLTACADTSTVHALLEEFFAKRESTAAESMAETTEAATNEAVTTEAVVIEEASETAAAFQLSDVQPIVKEGHYQFNPYQVSKEAIAHFDMEYLALYKDVVTAYMNYETYIPCSNWDYAKYIPFTLNNECPFYSGEDIGYDFDYLNQRIVLTYEVDRNTLQERIRLVADAMQNFMDLVSPDDDEADKIQTLYHAFCPLMTYDYDRVDSREKINGCYAFTEHSGICVTFADAFACLLSQVDLDATTASGDADDAHHVWNLVGINGQYYFFDTTFELNYKDGNAFVYYGMTMEERIDSGIHSEGMFLGHYYDREYEIAEIHLNVK